MSLTYGRSIDWFGLYTIVPPAFLPQSEIWSGYFRDAHYVLAIALITLVVVHTAGALVHHFFYKDNVLKRMLPFTRS